MKNYSLKFMLTCLIVASISSCSSDGSENPIPPTPEPPVTKKIPITLNCGISSTTRATDTGYDSGDKIGLYVVNYNGDTAGTLQQNGNHVDNMRFAYDGKWTPDKPIYWKDETTPADFYCYFPYGSSGNIEAYPFSVKEDQSTLANYKASEFLYGKASKISPTENAVNILTKHLFSCALIKVAAGNGFTTESLAKANVSVRLNGIKNEAIINLKDGSVSESGTPKTIQTLKEEGNYKALVVPQSVSADNLITVTVDGRDYNLKKEFTFVSAKRHTFTVTVSRTSNGINVGISNWEDDGTDNGGTAE